MSRAALLAAVTSTSGGVVSTASQLADRTADVATRPVLPVPSALVGLFPAGGLGLGTTVAVRGSRAVLLSLLAATTQHVRAAVVGMPDLGMLAAAEYGVDTERLALIPHPGTQVAEVVAAVLDGFAVVVLAAEHVLGADQRGVTLARRLSSRARHRAAVLLTFGNWPTPELTLNCSQARWHGLGHGHGHLTDREITVEATGRGAAGQARRACLHLPVDQSTASAGVDRSRQLGHDETFPAGRVGPRRATQPNGSSI
jgi:hypothetical protein